MSSKVDIADLTWEQKEMVLRYLFARMNKMTARASRTKTSVPLLLPSATEQWPKLMDKETWWVKANMIFEAPISLCKVKHAANLAFVDSETIYILPVGKFAQDN